jgi:hypothetical protein
VLRMAKLKVKRLVCMLSPVLSRCRDVTTSQSEGKIQGGKLGACMVCRRDTRYADVSE